MFEQIRANPLPLAPRLKAMRGQCKLLRPHFHGGCPCVAPSDCLCPEVFAELQRMTKSTDVRRLKFDDLENQLAAS